MKNVVSLDATKTKKPFVKGVLSDDEKNALEGLGLKPFVQEYKKLRQAVTSDDFASNTAAYQLLRAQLSAVIGAIAVSDRGFIESGGRNAYAYVAVHNLARDLANDLRSFSDQSESIERIRVGVIQPMLSKLATSIVSQLLKTRKELNTKLPPKSAKQMDTTLRSLQEDLTGFFTSIEAEAADRLQSSMTN